jgi:beta-glucosidase
MYDVFSLPAITFPNGFLWGSSTAGYQIEGDNIHSNHWHQEQANPKLARAGKASNHWELYRQDIALLAELEHKAYRMSIEWSRIEPREGHWDDAALAHYIDELERLQGKGIQVFVTLHHFTHPQWFEEKGAFRDYDNLKYFERYVSYLVPKVAPYVANWHVFNEFNLSLDPVIGPWKFNMIRAHALGYHLIRQHSKAPISTAHAFVDWFPRRRHDRLDNAACGYIDWCTNDFFFHALRTGELTYPYMDAVYDANVKGAIDYWAVNTYVRHMVDARSARFRGRQFAHKHLPMIREPFYLEEMFPEGLIANLERLTDKPVYITENGCACDDDRWRIVWIALHLSALREAIDRGVDVRGYLYWSTMDNYEWGSFAPRFGLVHVDFETFQRTLKPSAMYYRDIIRANGLTPEITRRYLSELPTLGT